MNKSFKMIFFILFINIMYVFFFHRQDFAILCGNLQSESLSIANIESTNNCEMVGDKIFINGEDPYIVFVEKNMILSNMNLQFDCNDLSLKMYYDIGEGFSEKYTKSLLNGKINNVGINTVVKKIRIDFEGKFNSDSGVKFDKIIINDREFAIKYLTCIEFFFYLQVSLIILIYFIFNKLENNNISILNYFGVCIIPNIIIINSYVSYLSIKRKVVIFIFNIIFYVFIYFFMTHGGKYNEE